MYPAVRMKAGAHFRPKHDSLCLSVVEMGFRWIQEGRFLHNDSNIFQSISALELLHGYAPNAAWISGYIWCSQEPPMVHRNHVSFHPIKTSEFWNFFR